MERRFMSSPMMMILIHIIKWKNNRNSAIVRACRPLRHLLSPGIRHPPVG